MARAYSQDLRDRVIDAVVLDGLSRRTAAHQFGVSAATAVKWLQDFECDGRRHPIGTGGHRPAKLAPEQHWILSAIKATPDLTLEALAARLLNERGVWADTGMLSRFFRRAGVSFKKNRIRHRARQA